MRIVAKIRSLRDNDNRRTLINKILQVTVHWVGTVVC